MVRLLADASQQAYETYLNSIFGCLKVEWMMSQSVFQLQHSKDKTECRVSTVSHDLMVQSCTVTHTNPLIG